MELNTQQRKSLKKAIPAILEFAETLRGYFFQHGDDMLTEQSEKLVIKLFPDLAPYYIFLELMAEHSIPPIFVQDIQIVGKLIKVSYISVTNLPEFVKARMLADAEKLEFMLNTNMVSFEPMSEVEESE